MPDSKIYNAICKSEPIGKGWSEDKKYCVTAADGAKYLLRVSDISEYDRKKAEYEMMGRGGKPSFRHRTVARLFRR
ncbi:MAG: hypothetical protein LBI44_04095 [Oscillospiraceae bacterium]|jgi:serine/threonine-protein kinase|nr:hypothetical protein [Oscillospiraceae bacterium]